MRLRQHSDVAGGLRPHDVVLETFEFNVDTRKRVNLVLRGHMSDEKVLSLSQEVAV